MPPGQIEMTSQPDAALHNRIACLERELALERRFRALVDASRDAQLLLGPRHEIRYVNPAAAALLGNSPESLLGLSLLDLLHPGERAAAGSCLTALLDRSGATGSLPVRVRQPDSSWRSLEATVTCPVDSSGSDALAIALRDAADAPAALLEAGLRCAAVGVALLDTRLRFVHINDALAAIDDFPREHYLGRTLAEVGPHHAALEPLFRHVLDTGRPVLDYELDGQHMPAPWRNRHWTTSCYPVRAGDGTLLGVGITVLEVTARWRAERALEESERWFRAVADLVPDLLWRDDLSARASWYNQRWLEYTGQTMEEAQELGWLEVMHPDDRETSLADFRRAIEAGLPFRSEGRIRALDGAFRWFLVQARPVRDGQGRVAQWFGAATDIHEQRTALEALRDSEGRLRLYVENVRDCALFQCDPEGRITGWNTGAERLFGHAEADVLGRSANVFHTPENVEAGLLRRELQDSVENGRSEVAEWVVRRDGSRFWARWLTSAIYDERGTLRGHAKVLRDETERRRAEEALRESEARFRTLAEANLIGVGTWRLDGRILWANDRFLEMVGHSRSDLEAGHLDWARMTPPECEEATAEALRQLKEAGRFTPFEKQMIRKDGSRVPVLLGGALVGGDQEGIAFALDLSERNLVERRLRASLLEKEVLLKEVHHRVRNNLQVIVSLLSLQARQTGSPEVLAALTEMHHRIQSIASIHKLLYQSETLADIPMGSYVRRLVADLSGFYRMGEQRVRALIEVGSDVVLGIDQAIPCGLVLNELVSNACKHAFPEGRSGTVSVSMGRAGEARCWLEVADTGIGLPAALQPAASTSLGLHLVYSLARQLGGQPEFHGGSGTRVRVEFPLRGPAVREGKSS